MVSDDDSGPNETSMNWILSAFELTSDNPYVLFSSRELRNKRRSLHMAALNRLLDTAQSIDLDGYSGKALSVFRRQMLIRLKDLHLTKAPTHLLRTSESSSRLPPAALSTQDPPNPQAGSTISSAQKASSGNRVPNK